MPGYFPAGNPGSRLRPRDLNPGINPGPVPEKVKVHLGRTHLVGAQHRLCGVQRGVEHILAAASQSHRQDGPQPRVSRKQGNLHLFSPTVLHACGARRNQHAVILTDSVLLYPGLTVLQMGRSLEYREMLSQTHTHERTPTTTGVCSLVRG